MISRRQFFGRAAVGVVGIAAIPFMPWDKLAKLFAPRFPKWHKIYTPDLQWRALEDIIYLADGTPSEWRVVTDTKRVMLTPFYLSTQYEYELAWENETDRVFYRSV